MELGRTGVAANGAQRDLQELIELTSPHTGHTDGRMVERSPDIPKPVSAFPIREGRTLLEIPEDALDLLQGTAEVFRDLSRQNVWVR